MRNAIGSAIDAATANGLSPSVPAVYFCHGAVPWQEKPPRFPRILRYAAVDLPCRDRVAQEACVPVTAVKVLYNFVNLASYPQRSPPPNKPRRALIFANHASEEKCVPIIREACARFSVEVDVIGIAAGNVSAAPGELLPRYDSYSRRRAPLSKRWRSETRWLSPEPTAADHL